MLKVIAFYLFLLVYSFTVYSQNPLNDPADAVEIRYDDWKPFIHYTLTIDPHDLTVFKVDIQIRKLRDTLKLAMFAHPEYDDRYWRYIRDMRVEATDDPEAEIIREDSSLWRVQTRSGELTVHYSVHLPAPAGVRNAWRPFLSSSGGLTGATQTFLYVVNATMQPCHVKFNIPPGWQIATGLEPTSDPTIFLAPSAAVLMDCPVLVGHFSRWSFVVDGVPHQVVYQPMSGAPTFDSITLVNNIQKIVEQAAKLFLRLPYREYFFLFQDSSYGALEHCNSVTLGMPARDLAKNINSYLEEIAHEYFHAWNIMRIRPREYGDINYKKPPLSKGLWFSEGLTMFYADLLCRRAHLPFEDSTRALHIEKLINRYFSTPGNSTISPEKVSMAAYGPPGMLGDYNASTHLQGELLGTMLDLIIRDSKGYRRNMDDVMRMMLQRYGGRTGFTNKNIEDVIAEVCHCNVHQFFKEYVRGNKPVSFNKYLQITGLGATVDWAEAKDAQKNPAADLMVYAWQEPESREIKIGITDPSGCWGKAGIHTGDEVIKANGQPVQTARDLRLMIWKMKVGDTISFEIKRTAGLFHTKVIVTGYKQPVVRIFERPDDTEHQRDLRKRWESGWYP